MKKFLKEFKEFALRGNVIDLAVGVIIGAAFQVVVASLTTNVISPIIGIFTGQNFDSLSWTIMDGVTLQYGVFITAVIQFAITAFVLFLVVRTVNRVASIGKHKEEAAPDKKKCPFCFTDIPAPATRCPNCTTELPVQAKPTNKNELSK